MANETATKSKRFYCVSLVPDICKTPMGPSTPPIPYSVIGEFSQATNESPNVKAHSEPVILHNRSVIPTVKGDEPGTAGGIKSGTYGKKVETKTASKTYFANGTATVQVGCEVWMNNRNTIGKIYERGGSAPRTRLEQIAALAQEELTRTIDDAKIALRPAAKHYKENVSEIVHDAAGSAMDKGGKLAMGGLAMAGTGAATSATGIGAPVGVPVAAIGSAGAAAGGTVSAVGAAVDTGATLLDYAADFILSNKIPDLKTAAMDLGQRAILGLVGNKLPMLKPVLGKGKVGKKSSPPRPAPQRPPDKAKGGKTKKNKEKKSDKPSDCCPKNKAPGGKAVSSRHPVHFGTGEEILYQTDFVVEGPTPLEWVRCYRSGSELEDWGMLGARWGTPFTASIAATGKGLVYVDDSGRPMMMPSLPPGAAFDNRKEGFTLTRSGDREFIIEWRDGSTDKFVRTPAADSWLPHGYEGVNAMRLGGEPVIAERFTISRMQGRDGRGITIDRFPDAKPGQVLLSVRSDEGQLIEAMRDDQVQALDAPGAPVRIGRVEEVRGDGTRVCHVRYEYGAEPAVAISNDSAGTIPARCNLVRQTNLVGSERAYSYRHHLLTSYTTYTGFEHTLQWISLAALRERWSGNTALADGELIERFPVTLENSYNARASATATADGLDGVRIHYVDVDTTRVIDANGGVLEYVFDANWLAVDVRRVDTTGVASSLGRRAWDGDGMLLAEINSAGRTTRYTYDAAGNLATITDALDRSSRIEYDAHNQPVAITDPMGHVTRLVYDDSSNITAQVDAVGQIANYRYDVQGKLISLTDAKGGVTQIRYDETGRLASYIDCSGYPKSYEYDMDGRVIAVIDALDQVTRYTYDQMGNMTSACQADGATERCSYDADGMLTVHTDAAGYETRYRYNGHGLPIERIDALGHAVQYRYNALLHLCELTNANGDSYYFTYDVEGRLTSETAFDGKKTNYKYDISGELVETECAGNHIHLLRDVLGRLVAKQTVDGVYRYGYDSLDRLILTVAPNAQNSFTYDPLGRLIEERSAYFLTPPQADLMGPRKADACLTISHAYDELGNRLQTVLPTGQRIDILRYGSGHWHGVLWEGHNVVDVERDPLHRETLRRFGSDQPMTSSRQYDPQSRISRMTLRPANNGSQHPRRDRRFTYDVTSNLLELAHELPSHVDAARTFTYQYNAVGQLLRALQPEITETFGFDPSENLIEPHTGQLHDETENKAPRCVKGNRVDTYRGYEYVHDSQGNRTRARRITSDERCNYRFDSESRLVEAVRDNGSLSLSARYFYDAFGRRIAKIVTADTRNGSASLGNLSDFPATHQSELIQFSWDGDTLSQEFRQDATITFIYEPDSFIPLARVECTDAFKSERFGVGAVQFYFCDHLGTPDELVDKGGKSLWSRFHTAWGEDPRRDVKNLTDLHQIQPLRFQGQYADQETALHYNRYRYYDPSSARFITPDPVGLLGGTNPYMYGPSPTSWIDALGLSKCSTNAACNPCDGRNPSATARKWQGLQNAPYFGQDSYRNVVMKKGTVIYTLYPHGAVAGNYFSRASTVLGTRDARAFNDALQVAHSGNSNHAGVRPMRTQVHAYILEQDTCVAVGRAKKNPRFGRGGAFQYFIEDMDKPRLGDTGKILGFR